MKKKLAFLLSICTVFCSAGCTNKNQADTNGDVTLKWVLLGPGIQDDSEKVWQKVNEKLKTYEGMENTSVDVEILDGADYQQKFVLMQTSGQQLDIVQTCSLDFYKEVKNKSFIELDDYLAKTDAYNNAFPDWFWDYGKVNGKLYQVPNYQFMAYCDYSLYTQKALADKYWDVEKAQQIMYSEDTFTDKCWDVIEDYLDTLNEKGELKMGYLPLDSLTFTLRKGFESVGNRCMIRMNDPEHKVVYMDEVPERLNSFKRVAQLYKKGYVRKDIASISGADADSAKGTADGYTLWHDGTNVAPELYKKSIDSTEERYGFPVVAARTADYDYIPSKNAAGGNAVSVNSKNPEKAFEFITLMNTEKGKDLYNLMTWGVEGEHYDVVDGDIIKPKDYLSQADSSSKYGQYCWAVGNTKFSLVPQPNAALEGSKIDEFNTADNVMRSTLTGFVPDTSSLTTEIAQINTVFEEYKALNLGTYDDVEATYNEYMEKVKQAGLDKVKAELQKQVDEFFKNKK